MDMGLQPQELRWGSSASSKRKRCELTSMNGSGDTGHTGLTGEGQNGAAASHSIQKPCRKHSGFVMIEGRWGVYYSESWEPNGSTLYRPLSASLLANLDKYDQISFEQGCFCVGDEAGRFQHKAQGQAIHCWRYSDQDKKLFIALSYFFTDFQVFQEVLNSLECL